ncbi:-Ribosome-recycling factor [Babesia bigemina]|uniref:-Ribosome-recycling factor n=1 Tax=Babesia bigemina TaxID=5866 RepID=A0A061DAH3_BABBI|nr:-Ribosome-recycling factor [Babesia bigemina]CDR97696.1 -Ribosome-recycling factor [Babesia bigemina]|eukprot:XP_012769882.1 -Ribosome-recycling factor [Babesia bigemina]
MVPRWRLAQVIWLVIALAFSLRHDLLAAALSAYPLSRAGVCAFVSRRPAAPRCLQQLDASRKKKNRSQGRTGKGGSDGRSDDDEVEEFFVSEADLEAVFAGLRSKLKESEQFLSNKISRLALHRATPSLIESLTVELPGDSKEKQLQYVAQIMSKGPYELHVVPLSAVHLDAIFVSLSTKLVDYKVSMMADRVSVVVPSMTEAMVRQARSVVKETLNEVKTQIRLTRQAVIKKLKHLHQAMSDDMFFRQQKEVDAVVKQSEKRVDEVANEALRGLA